MLGGGFWGVGVCGVAWGGVGWVAGSGRCPAEAALCGSNLSAAARGLAPPQPSNRPPPPTPTPGPRAHDDRRARDVGKHGAVDVLARGALLDGHGVADVGDDLGGVQVLGVERDWGRWGRGGWVGVGGGDEGRGHGACALTQRAAARALAVAPARGAGCAPPTPSPHPRPPTGTHCRAGTRWRRCRTARRRTCAARGSS
jgi:hypothetical protein